MNISRLFGDNHGSSKGQKRYRAILNFAAGTGNKAGKSSCCITVQEDQLTVKEIDMVMGVG
jgi:hypothetical protein